jgi:hypothetical protein
MHPQTYYVSQMVRRGVLLLSSENTRVLGGGLPKKPPEIDQVYSTVYYYTAVKETLQPCRLPQYFTGTQAFNCCKQRHYLERGTSCVHACSVVGCCQQSERLQLTCCPVLLAVPTDAVEHC